MNSVDVLSDLNDKPMRRIQIVAIALVICLNALDGFDILAISFAAPGIASEWGINRADLGFVLSMELLGMAVGSLVLGRAADRFGRRSTILGCLSLMAIGMFMSATAQSVITLSLWRVFTGLGIGGMLAALSAVTAEYSNSRRRNLCIALMAVGYPTGSLLGGLIVAQLLEHGSWRSVFLFGGGMTSLFIFLVCIFLRETPAFLISNQPPDALKKLNTLLHSMGVQPVADLPPKIERKRQWSLAELFTVKLRSTTILVTLSYFCHILTTYYLVKWTPKIVFDAGYSQSEAAQVLVWYSLGGAAGCALFGFLAQRISVKKLLIPTMLGSAAVVAVFGSRIWSLEALGMLALAAGALTNGAIVGLFTLFTRSFPTHLRATGVGFTLGLGRGGAALSPILAGGLLGAGFGVGLTSTYLALGSIIAAVAIVILKVRFIDETPA